MYGAKILPVEDLPEVVEAFNLGKAIAERITLIDGDIVAVSQKVVSKSEGRVVRLDETDPGPEAVALAGRTGKDPRLVQHILDESRNLIRVDEDRGILITETHHGFICAKASISQTRWSKTRRSCSPSTRTGRRGESGSSWRPLRKVEASWSPTASTRHGFICANSAGIDASMTGGDRATRGAREMTATVIATADQIAGASDLVRTKTGGVPAVVIRGLEHL